MPVPPVMLVFMVAGTTEVRRFFHGGSLAAESIRATLARHGTDVAQLGSILDFGCGCGRVLRHWADLRAELHGTDTNPRLVDSCARNLPYAHFERNRPLPPTTYWDGQFDLIYALSVFTHLPEERQRAWIRELTRILKPGGHLMLSTHGVSCMDKLTRRERERFRRGELVVRFGAAAGSNLCVAYHPPAYVRGTLAAGLELVDFIPEGAKGNPQQDLVLFRKPATVHSSTHS